jgi:hypothetical protein
MVGITAWKVAWGFAFSYVETMTMDGFNHKNSLTRRVNAANINDYYPIPMHLIREEEESNRSI